MNDNCSDFLKWQDNHNITMDFNYSSIFDPSNHCFMTKFSDFSSEIEKQKTSIEKVEECYPFVLSK